MGNGSVKLSRQKGSRLIFLVFLARSISKVSSNLGSDSHETILEVRANSTSFLVEK